MKATVCRPGELGLAEVEAWRSMHALDPQASPFLSPEFALAAGRCRSDVRVAIFEEAAESVGFWAFTVNHMRAAGPVAPGFSDCQGIVHNERFTWNSAHILAACALNGWAFDHLIASQALSLGTSSTFTRCCIVDLTDGWDNYFAWGSRTHKSLFKQMRRNHRRIQNDLGNVAFQEHLGYGKLLPEILRLKSAQCRRNGWKDPFSDGWARDMLVDLAETVAPNLAGVTSTLHIGGRLAACDFSLRGRTVQAGWIKAFDQEFSRYSPGLVIWPFWCQSAVDAGVRYLHLGEGKEQYKWKLANDEAQLASGFLRGCGARGALFALRHRPHRTVEQLFERYPTAEQAAERAIHRLRSLRHQTR